MTHYHTGPDPGPDLGDNTTPSHTTRDRNTQKGGTLAWRPRQVDGNGATTPRRGDRDDGVTLMKDGTADVDV